MGFFTSPPGMARILTILQTMHRISIVCWERCCESTSITRQAKALIIRRQRPIRFPDQYPAATRSMPSDLEIRGAFRLIAQPEKSMQATSGRMRWRRSTSLRPEETTVGGSTKAHCAETWDLRPVFRKTMLVRFWIMGTREEAGDVP